MYIADSDKSERIKRLRKKAMSLTTSPGVYIMHDKSGKIIYIGKAKVLKNRVSQYFGSDTNHSDKVKKMVSQVEDFEYIICTSEFEALILECSLIKQHLPKYNILLKDDKGYSYVKISKGKWKTVSRALQKENDGATYIGPYNSGYIVKETVEEARKIFKLPACSKNLDNVNKKTRPCLDYYIGLCSAPCAGKISFNDYNESVKSAIEYIRGGSKLSVKEMTEEMEKASEALDFERAARLRDRIRAIKKITEKQKVTACTYRDQDVIAFVNSNNSSCAEVFIFRKYKLIDRHQFLLPEIDNGEAFRAEFLKSYYGNEENIPPRIVIDEDCDDRQLIEKMFSQKCGHSIEIIVPKIGEQKSLIEMAKENASEYLSEMTGRKSHELNALDELSKLLNLNKIPEYIESYDISHTAGSDNVGGMVVFKNGQPLRSDYKRFKIKSFVGQDDLRSMAEVIERRFNEYLNAENRTSGFGRLPDLILLDGGINQLRAVTSVLQRKKINVPVFGMVKDSKHRTNAIESSGGTIEIKSNRSAYTLVTSIQDEVHRFAIGYHHKLKENNMLYSQLTDIPGVGKTTAEKLLRHFKTIDKIKKAKPHELSVIKGLKKETAQNIYNYFNAEE